MKICVVACTKKGVELGSFLAEKIREADNGYDVAVHAISRHVKAGAEVNPITGSLAQWTAEYFYRADALIFISACGIVVRMIAPFLKGKDADPAVVAIDELGTFAVPLLSGHIGGANALARCIAGITGGQAVISTATDLNGLVGIDEWAVHHDCVIGELEMVKHISGALLEGEEVGLYSEFPINGRVPDGFRKVAFLEEKDRWSDLKLGVCITPYREKQPFPRTLNLFPKVLTLGIGCRRYTSMQVISQVVGEALDQRGLTIEALRNIASIDLKKDEQGLEELAATYGVEFLTYTADQLNRAEGDFSSSEFVRTITGTDNVAERAAVLASGGGRLIGGRTVGEGVTVAVAAADWQVVF